VTIETAQCPRCPAWMIRYPTFPVGDAFRLGDSVLAWNTEWWCNCGYVQCAGPIEPGIVADQRLEWWQAVNRQRLRDEEQAAAQVRPWWRFW
jgi:hypothetical protein